MKHEFSAEVQGFKDRGSLSRSSREVGKLQKIPRDLGGQTCCGSGDPRSQAELQVEKASSMTHTLRMKRLKIFWLLLLGAAVLSGCTKPETEANSAAPPDSSEPTNAQPKLQTIKLYLGPEEINAEMALTPRQRQIGMMFRTNLLENDAMIFVFSYPFQASFWMHNCPESLSAAYIDPDGVIQEIHHLEKWDTNSVVAASDNIQFVLEVKDGWFARHNISTGTVIRTERGTLQQTFFQDR
jgi:uncharacterized protein